jgi:hypothetical protein
MPGGRQHLPPGFPSHLDPQGYGMSGILAHLGTCVSCDGPLCVSGQQVACERCGLAVKDHPLTAGVPAPEPPSSWVAPPADFQGGHGDRILALERKVAAMEARLASMPTRKGA